MTESNELRVSNDVAAIAASLAHIEKSVDALRGDHKELVQAINELNTKLALVQMKQESGNKVWDWVSHAIITAVLTVVVSTMTVRALGWEAPRERSSNPDLSHIQNTPAQSTPR